MASAFGCASVHGLNLVPRPAEKIIAFITINLEIWKFGNLKMKENKCGNLKIWKFENEKSSFGISFPT
jgi:hypothetical protein